MKKIISFSLSFVIMLSMLLVSNTVTVFAASIEVALQWAIDIANDDSHGYSQQNRWGPDYDCSSFIVSALKYAGFDVGSASYTGNMRSNLTSHGFTWIPWSQIGGQSNLKRGDILLAEGSHTEFYLGNGKNVGAHSNRGYPQTGDQTGTEVSVSGYYNHPWDGVLRCGSIPTYFPGEEDTSYDVPGWFIANQKSNTYDDNGNMESNHWIDAGDNCYVEKVYTNGFCRVKYPTSSGERWAYAKASIFDISKKGSKPTGYNIRVSSTNVYDCESVSITITPFEDNFTNIRVYLVKPNGSVIFRDFGTTKTVSITPNQLGVWKIYARVDNANGSFEGSTSNGCLSVNVSRPDMGNKVDLGSDFYAYIVNNDSGNVLTNDNDNVSSKTLQSSSNQRWHFKKQSDGSYQIESVSGNGKCLDAYSGKGHSGDNVQVYKQDNEPVQQWWIYSAGSSLYYLMPTCSGSAVLDVNGASKESGANVQIWAYNQTVAQKFEIRKIGSASFKLSTNTVNLDMSSTNSHTITLTAEGMLPSSYKFVCNRDTSALSTLWGSWSGNTITLSVKGLKTGTYNIKIMLNDSSNDNVLAIQNISVNVKCSHNYGYWSTTKSPTCISDGYQTRKCSVCGNVETQTLYTTGHSYTSTVKNPTCTEPGYTLHTCNKCGTSYKDSYKEAKGHSYFSVVVQPTYTTQGYTEYVCGSCEYRYIDDYTPVKQYIIAYSLNGGSGTIANQTKVYGQDLILSSTKPTRTGYTFIGWSTNKNDTTAMYQPNGKYSDNKDIILYAIWKENSLINNSTISKTTINKGESVTLTGKATGGISPYKYTYLYKKTTDTSWKTAKDWSTATSVSIKPAVATTYDVCVKVQDSKGTVVKKYFTVKVNPSPLTNISTISKTTINKGESVTLTGKATGGTSPYKYTYLYKKTTDTSWKTARDWSTAISVSIKPAVATTYDVCVKVQDSKGTVVKKYFTVKVNPSPLINISTISKTTINKGESVTLNGSATGGTSPYKYAYYYKKTSDTSWKTAKNWSSTTSVSITPTEVATYDICIKVQDSKGTVVKKYFKVSVTSSSPLANNSTISKTTINKGESVTITGKATGGTAPYKYAYFYKKTTDTSWKIAKDWSTTTSVSITPTEVATYDICIKVQDSKGTLVKKYFKVSVTNSALANNSTISKTTISKGGSVTLTGKATGGTSPYKYAYYYKKTSATSWTTAKDWSTTTSVSIKPTESATYDVCVKVQDSKNTVAKQYFKLTVN